MGYGLTTEEVRGVAYRSVEHSGRKHPFKNGKAGQDCSSLAWNALDGPNSRSDIQPGFRG